MHYGARFYSPRLGRFVSADSIVPNPLSPQDLNRFSYASNNPLRYRDPTGHQNWDAVNEYFMGVVYQIGANNWEAMGVSSVAAVRAGAEEVAQEHSDSMAFEVGRLCGSLGTALQGLGEVEGGLAAAEAGVAVSGTGVGALVGVPVAVGGVAVAEHGSVLVGQSVGQAAFSAGRLIQMAGRKGGPSGKTEEHHIISPETKKYDFKNHPAIKESGIDIGNDPDNLVDLPGHRGRHTYKYHDYILERLDELYELHSGTPELEMKVREQLKTWRQDLLSGKLDPYMK
jgi:hypothetical protein